MNYLEIAQITSDTATGDRVVRYRQKGSNRQTVTIDSTSSLMEPLCYPILFSRGEKGWGKEMKTERKVEFQSYLACRLLRPDPDLEMLQGPADNRTYQPVNRFQTFSRVGKFQCTYVRIRM
jgi:hypothetical protein